MTIIETLPASSGVRVQRHAIFAIGSGLTGLVATKALKLAQLNITDALVFVTGMAVHGTSHLVRQASHWAPTFPAVITMSVLATLVVVAVIDLVNLIVSQPDSGWTTQSGTAKGLV